MSSKSKILVVDDEQKNLDILSFTLEDEFDLKTAASGEEALELLDLFKPDVILLDVMMHGIDGYEVCRRIRSSATHQFMKIILVSGKALAEERLQGYEAGADDYVTKPFDADELLAKVKVYLKLKNAEEVDSIKDSFLSLISHETNTPLNGVIGLSELLLESSNLNEDELESVQMIYESGHRLQELMDKARFLCELKTGDMIHPTMEILSGVVGNACSVVRNRHRNKRSIELSIPHDLEFEADWHLLGKAIEFLIDNAIKFSPDDTTVNIHAEVEDHCCVLEIIDNGRGIPEEEMSLLFSAFNVGDVCHHTSGIGLSLAIVQEVAKKHGGCVEATSSVGEKTQFTLIIPMRS